MTDTVEHAQVVGGVVLRFAGDSGDGMQLAGERFTSVSAAFGNDLETLPDFPAEIRAPAGTLAGRLELPGPDRRPLDHDAGRHAQRPRRDEPRGPEDEPRGARPGRDDHREHRLLRRASRSPRPATPTNPLTDGSLGSLHGLRGADDLDHPGGLQGGGGQAPRRRALEELLRPRLGVLALHATHRPHRLVDRAALRVARPEVKEANLRAFRAGYDFGETTELFDSRYEVQAAPFPAGEYANVTGNTALSWGLITAAQTWRACRCSWAATRSRRPRTSSTSSPSARSSASARSRPKTRSPRSPRRSARATAARSA